MKTAAISYVTRSDGAFLVAWNRRFGGWGFPGGKCEDGETMEQCQARELREECGVSTTSRQFIYSDTSGIEEDVLCQVYRVEIAGMPCPREINTGLAWVDKEFMKKHSFAPAWYERFFDGIKDPVLPS